MMNTARKIALTSALALGVVGGTAGLASASTTPQTSPAPQTGEWTCCTMSYDGSTICLQAGAPAPVACLDGWVSVDLSVHPGIYVGVHPLLDIDL